MLLLHSSTMEQPKKKQYQISSPQSSGISFSTLNISPSSYLKVPNTLLSTATTALPAQAFFEEDINLSFPILQQSFDIDTLPAILEPVESCENPQHSTTQISQEQSGSGRLHSNLSVLSSSPEVTVFSYPPAKVYRNLAFPAMSGSRKISLAEKDQLVQSLRSHHVNTVVELRRIEKAFALLGSPDVTEPMTAAWSYYVNSHSLLTELRGLSRNYPFSSECLEEAKRRVYSDPQSNSSWNFCWLVLSKMRNDQLISHYARSQAQQPAMWGGRIPTPEEIAKLSEAFDTEWSWAVDQMLRHWSQPPTR